VVTIEDGTVRGGFGSGVLELLAAAGVHVPVKLMGLPDAFVEHGPPATLLASFGLDAEGIAAAARELLGSASGTAATESALAG
jgi:1-deoxy-D-xylulose-5-phosphate synthase